MKIGSEISYPILAESQLLVSIGRLPSTVTMWAPEEKQTACWSTYLRMLTWKMERPRVCLRNNSYDFMLLFARKKSCLARINFENEPKTFRLSFHALNMSIFLRYFLIYLHHRWGHWFSRVNNKVQCNSFGNGYSLEWTFEFSRISRCIYLSHNWIAALCSPHGLSSGGVTLPTPSRYGRRWKKHLMLA